MSVRLHTWLLTALRPLVAMLRGAQEGAKLRVGSAVSPDSWWSAGIYKSPALAPLVLLPNLEVGIGDNLPLIAVNGQFAYKSDHGLESAGTVTGGRPGPERLPS